MVKKVEIRLPFSAKISNLAAEVARLLQGEDEGSHDFVAAFLVVGTIGDVGLEVLHQLSIDIEAEALVVALQLNGLAFAGLALVPEVEEVAVPAETEHPFHWV